MNTFRTSFNQYKGVYTFWSLERIEMLVLAKFGAQIVLNNANLLKLRI